MISKIKYKIIGKDDKKNMIDGFQKRIKKNNYRKKPDKQIKKKKKMPGRRMAQRDRENYEGKYRRF